MEEKHVKAILNTKEQQYKGSIVSTTRTEAALLFSQHPCQCENVHGNYFPFL